MVHFNSLHMPRYVAAIGRVMLNIQGDMFYILFWNPQKYFHGGLKLLFFYKVKLIPCILILV